MAITDTHIVDWSTDPTENLPTDGTKFIAYKLSGAFRSMKAVARQESLNKQWERLDLAPTYISATSFSLTGDQTAVAYALRKFKSTSSSGTGYGFVVSSAFVSVTTVTVQMLQGGLDSGLSEVEWGVAKPNFPCIKHHSQRGNTTIADLATSATVTLSLDEPDTDYFVKITPSEQSNSPSDGSLIIVSVTKSTSSFNFSIAAAPGSGKDRTYMWNVLRMLD